MNGSVIVNQFEIPCDHSTIRQIAVSGKVNRGGPVKAPLSEVSQRVKGYSRKHYCNMYANDFSVLNPTIWAQEAILQLLPNMVLGQLINRDFDTRVARFGDIVNSFVPGNFQMTRKQSLGSNITIQDASGTAVQVALNQLVQVSFQVNDGEEDRSALDLVDTLLVPAVIALATGIDRILSAQVNQFAALGQGSGHLGLISPTNVKAYILAAHEQMNRQKVPLPGRSMILSPATETNALQLDTIVTAQNTGDGGTALQTAILGEKYGFQFLMAQTQPEIAFGQTSVATTIAAGFRAGATAFNVSSGTGLAAGMWFTIAGDDQPNQIVAVTSSVTITPRYPIPNDVSTSAAFVSVVPGAVNNSGGYIGTTLHPRVIGWSQGIQVSGFSNSAPQIGQIVTFGVDPVVYTITGLLFVSTGIYSITLDQPLTTAIANNATVNLGPAGKYNFALLRNAFSLVNRPLPFPRAGTGATAKVLSDPVNKFSIRVTVAYDLYKQCHVVTLDALIGVGVLNAQLGIAMYG